MLASDCFSALRRLGFDRVQFVNQCAEIRLQAGDLRRCPVRRKGARQPLQQPGAEGVEPLHRAHIDIDMFDVGVPPGGSIDLRLEAAGVLRHPGAGGGQMQPVALQRAMQQGTRHSGQAAVFADISAAEGLIRATMLDPRL